MEGRLVVYPCLSHYLRRVLNKPSQVGGWEWDFRTINCTNLDQYLGFWKLYTFGHLFGSWMKDPPNWFLLALYFVYTHGFFYVFVQVYVYIWYIYVYTSKCIHVYIIYTHMYGTFALISQVHIRDPNECRKQFNVKREPIDFGNRSGDVNPTFLPKWLPCFPFKN